MGALHQSAGWVVCHVGSRPANTLSLDYPPRALVKLFRILNLILNCSLTAVGVCKINCTEAVKG